MLITSWLVLGVIVVCRNRSVINCVYTSPHKNNQSDYRIKVL